MRQAARLRATHRQACKEAICKEKKGLRTDFRQVWTRAPIINKSAFSPKNAVTPNINGKKVLFLNRIKDLQYLKSQSKGEQKYAREI